MPERRLASSVEAGFLHGGDVCVGEKRRTAVKNLGLPDFLVLAFVATLVWIIVSSHRVRPEDLASTNGISLRPSLLPYYALRSVVRMGIAFVLSTVFTMVYGYIAAHYRTAEAILIPLLDILQSVPVLGFLSVTIASFASLFPDSTTGFELASVFAIFTSQAWNMTFAFYQSLLAVPRDLREASQVFGLTRWQEFKFLELPASMINLVWNGMMSFGGGWFFLAASEAITVLGKNVRLPGIGSYMATAIERSDMGALMASLGTMVAVIVLIDQVIWRPLVAWSRKFKVEFLPGDEEAGSRVFDILSRSFILRTASEVMAGSFLGVLQSLSVRTRRLLKRFPWVADAFARLFRFALVCLCLVAIWWSAYHLWSGIVFLWHSVDIELVFRVFQLGFLTLLRVLASVVLGLAWTVPVGVKIGTNPRVRKIAQPIVQIAASFPANMLFPFVTMLYVKYRVNFELGAIPLMMLGTQWYLLFNIIGGAMAIPADLAEAATVFRLRGCSRWRHFILPCIFPSIVTGGITAAGGAWNASIVAEISSWGTTTLEASGLGSFITRATVEGDWPSIILGIAAMSLIVVLFNRFVWRKLYAAAEELRASY